MNKLFGPKKFFFIIISVLLTCGILLFNKIIDRRLILLIVLVTIIIFLQKCVICSWVYPAEKSIFIWNVFLKKRKFEWKELTKITFLAQAFHRTGISFEVSTRYFLYSNKIEVDTIDTIFWGQAEKDEFNILIFDKAEEYGFSVEKLDAEIWKYGAF